MPHKTHIAFLKRISRCYPFVIQKVYCFKQIILIAIVVTGFNNSVCLSQSPALHLEGQVVDAEEKRLARATISLIDKDHKAVLKETTDSNGLFHLYYSLPGNYMLQISHTGYNAHTSAQFELKDKDFGTIRLTNATQTLGEVVIASTQKLIDADAGSITYHVYKSIDAQGVSALEALKKAPGVFIGNDNSISLNGKGGVTILLDGRQTYLSGQELTDLLKSMPASGIKSIEIITNPTAKYDASGSAGLINIKTNKSQIKGFSGTTTTGISYGVTLKQNQDISLNYRKNNFNIYGSYNHFIGNYNYLYGSDRYQNTRTYNSATDDTDKRKRLGTRLGVDYNLNKKSTIGVLLNGNFVLGGGITRTKTGISFPDALLIEQTLFAENDYYFQQTARYNVNLN